VNLIQQSIMTIQVEEYMDFVQDFLVTFANVIDEQIMGIAQAVIARVKQDLQNGSVGNTSILFT